MPILKHIFTKRNKKIAGHPKKKDDSFVKKPAPPKEFTKEALSESKSKKKSGASVIKSDQAHVAHDVIVRPHISEKSVSKNTEGKYVFEIYSGVSKKDVTSAIEDLYGVKVEKVNRISVKPKNKRYRRDVGSKPRHDKAVVTLKEGHGIEVLPQ